MHKKNAGFLLIGICIALALLLLAGIMDRITAGIVFAIALMVGGALSRGFTRNS